MKIFLNILIILIITNAPTIKAQVEAKYIEPVVLKGTVSLAKDHSPLPGASVYIPDLKLGVVSDEKGAYIFKQLPKGSFLVSVNFLGCKSITRIVTINGAITQNFELEESSREVEQVTITGISKATEIKRNPVPIATISAEYITTNSSTNIIDAIAKVPGVRAVTTGPNISKPFIRGLGYNRILTLFDGIRQEGQQWGDEHGIEVDPYSINNIEVIKGPASLSFGSDALAGVVNMIPTQPAPEGKMLGEMILENQSNNRYLGSSAVLKCTKNGIEWVARLTHRQATNYWDKIDGRVFGSAFNETDANASIGVHRSWGFSHLTLVLFNDMQEIPDGSRDSASRKFTKQVSEADTFRPIVSNTELVSYRIQPIHQLVQHYRIYSTNSFIIGDGTMDVNLGYQFSARREFSHPALHNVPGLYLQLQSYTYNVKYNLPEIKHWGITTGINGMYQANTSTNGTEFIIPSFNQFDIGAFALAKRSFGKLDISGGFRYDTRHYHNRSLYVTTSQTTGFEMPTTDTGKMLFPNYSNSFSGASGSMGATYNFTDKLTIKSNIARGFRAPNIAEVSANGVHPGTNVYQIGNPDFKPEFSLQEDIGFVYATKKIELSIGVFDNYIDNYIYNQKVVGKNGNDTVIVKGNQTFKFAAARANLYGGELTVDIHPVKVLHFENNISMVNGDNLGAKGGIKPADSTRYLPFIPPFHGLSELRFDYRLKRFRVEHGYIKIQFEYYATQNRVFSAYNTETATHGYSLFNVSIGGSIVRRKNKSLVNIYVACNNVFDAAYQDHLSRLKYFERYRYSPTGYYGIYNMGRNFSVKLIFPLSFGI